MITQHLMGRMLSHNIFSLAISCGVRSSNNQASLKILTTARPLRLQSCGRTTLRPTLSSTRTTACWNKTQTTASGLLRQQYSGHSAFKRNYSSSEATWLWPVTEVVHGFYEANKHGTRTGIAGFTFDSDIPLEEVHFQKAFEYMMRKCPNMRTVVREKDDSAWYCQMKNYKMDFKFLNNEETFEEDSIAELKRGFQDTDTLPWKARVIPRRPDSPFRIEGGKTTHPFQYRLLFLINHAVIDGVDCVIWSSSLLHGLNNAVGDQFYKEKEYGIFEDIRDFEIQVQKMKLELQRNSEKLKEVIETLPKFTDTPILMQAFPRPNVSEPATRYQFHTIDPLVKEGVLSKCKQMGVSFNSFFISVANVAIVEVAEEAGILRDIWDTHSLIYMDTRRYMHLKKHLIGCYMRALTYKCKIRSNERNYFWDFCKLVDHELHSLYNKGLVIDQVVAQAQMDSEYKPFNYTDNPRPVLHDITSNYAGDLTKFYSLPDASHVHVTDIMRYQLLHNTRNALEQEILTLKGKTAYRLHYANNYISEEVVTRFTDKIFKLIEIVGK